MCFLPKRRASSDQAPGPIMATLAPMAAKRSEIQENPPREKPIHNSTATTVAPEMGVQSPTRRSVPAAAAIISGMIADSCEVTWKCAAAQ